MSVITIPKNLIKKDDLVIIPRKEYEEFSQWRETIQLFKIFKATPAQKKDLKKARQDYKKGKYFTLNELKNRMGIKS